MAHLLVVVALISYGLEISPCAYAPIPNCWAERQHVCAPYWLWSYTHDSFFQSFTAHFHEVSSPPVLYDCHPNKPFHQQAKESNPLELKGLIHTQFQMVKIQ